MKKAMPVLFVSAIVILTIFNFCQDEKANVNLYAQNIPAGVKIDTVNSIFSVTFAPQFRGCITAIGADLIFDETAFEYLPDSTKKYGVFSHEVINFFEPNRISFGFNSSVDVCSFSKDKPIFTIAFKVKDEIDGVLKYFELQNVDIQRNGKQIKFRQETATLPVFAMQFFSFNWIIEVY